MSNDTNQNRFQAGDLVMIYGTIGSVIEPIVPHLPYRLTRVQLPPVRGLNGRLVERVLGILECSMSIRPLTAREAVDGQLGGEYDPFGSDEPYGV